MSSHIVRYKCGWLMQVDYSRRSDASTILYTRLSGLALPSSASVQIQQLEGLLVKHAKLLGTLPVTLRTLC